MLHPQLSEIAMSRAFDIAAMGKSQTWSEELQQVDTRRYASLLLFIQIAPPIAKLIRVFNVPFHTNMPPAEYNLKGITV
jgi:hypothetical protein